MDPTTASEKTDSQDKLSSRIEPVSEREILDELSNQMLKSTGEYIKSEVVFWLIIKVREASTKQYLMKVKLNKLR